MNHIDYCEGLRTPTSGRGYALAGSRNNLPPAVAQAAFDLILCSLFRGCLEEESDPTSILPNRHDGHGVPQCANQCAS